MPSGQKPSRPYMAPSLILLLLSAGISLAGYGYCQAEKVAIEDEIRNKLRAIADLRVQQIVLWQRERAGATALLARNPLVAAAPNAGSDRQLWAWLDDFRKLCDYTDLAVLERDGRARGAAPGASGAADPNVLALLAEALRTGAAVTSDLHEAGAGSVVMDFVAPLPNARGGRARRAVFLRADASAFLHAMAPARPGQSRTAECLLVRAEGDTRIADF